MDSIFTPTQRKGTILRNIQTKLKYMNNNTEFIIERHYQRIQAIGFKIHHEFLTSPLKQKRKRGSEKKKKLDNTLVHWLSIFREKVSPSFSNLFCIKIYIRCMILFTLFVIRNASSLQVTQKFIHSFIQGYQLSQFYALFKQKLSFIIINRKMNASILITQKVTLMQLLKNISHYCHFH